MAAWGMAVCPACADRFARWPLPRWLHGAAVVVAVVLGIALVRSWHYFAAEAAFARAHRLLVQERFAEAKVELDRVLAVAPRFREGILLKAKADFLTDDLDAGFRAFAPNLRFEGDLAREVATLAHAANEAVTETEEAQRLDQERKFDEALAHVQEAARRLPTSRHVRGLGLGIEARRAFANRDYLFAAERRAELARLQPQSMEAQANWAGALAAQYATSGDASLREQAREHLERAHTLCKTDDERAEWRAFAERLEDEMRSSDVLRGRGEAPSEVKP